MTGKAKPTEPSISDAAVKAKTGKDWAAWLDVLDSAGIVRILSEKHGVPSWWRQMIAVEYERARGLRVRHQTASGFSVAISKTIPTSLSRLYAATANSVQRRQWFPKGAFELSSQTKDKYFRGSWNQSARLEIGFFAKVQDKAQIAVQVSKLAKQADVELEREAWKAALSRLQQRLQQ
jgi:hypothetical protein